MKRKEIKNHFSYNERTSTTDIKTLNVDHQILQKFLLLVLEVAGLVLSNISVTCKAFSCRVKLRAQIRKLQKDFQHWY